MLGIVQRGENAYVIVPTSPSASRPNESPATAAVLPTIVVTNSGDSDAHGFVAESTSTATRTDTPLLETPQSIQVVTQDVIKRQQSQSVADALRNVSGVEIQSSTNKSAVGGSPIINGFPAQVTVNGSLPASAGQQNTVLLLPMAAISRVEVLKGADTIVSGTGDPGGTVNVVTKIPETTASRELTLQMGSYGDWLGAVDLTGPVSSEKRLAYRFIVSGERAGQSYGGFDGKRDFYIAPSLRWKDASTDLIVGFEQQATHSPYSLYGVIGPDGVIREPYQNRQSYMVSNVTGAHYDWTQKLAEGITFHSVATYSAAEMSASESASLFAVSNGNAFYSFNGQSHNRTSAIALDNNLRADLVTGPVKQVFMLGYVYNLQRSHGFGAYGGNGVMVPLPSVNISIPAETGGYDYSERNYYSSLYFQDQISWGRLHVLASISHGRAWSSPSSSPKQEKWNPNIGVAYELTDNWTVFANEQHSFSPNTDAYLAPGVLGPPLTGQSVEAGVKFLLLDDKLSGSLAVHRSRYQNQMIANFANPGYFVAIPNGQTARGVSFDISGQLLPGLAVIANYSYNAYTFSEEQKRLGAYLNSARHSGSLWATYDFQGSRLHGWGFGAGLWARGGYTTNTADYARSVSMPGQARVDASIYYRSKRWSSTLGVKNLLNRRLYDDRSVGNFVGIQPGRIIYLTNTLDF
nr:TonB-dependent receptor [Burkholderia metallica]